MTTYLIHYYHRIIYNYGQFLKFNTNLTIISRHEVEKINEYKCKSNLYIFKVGTT